ncbi:MAG: DUF6115 domain-containing protein [Bacillota bacterium]
MISFYASIMFIGILLIMISLVWIAFERKKGLDDENRIDEKREELLRIIADAEMMVEELNKFSDYIVSQVDQKNREALETIKYMEEKAKIIMEESVDALNVGRVGAGVSIVNGNSDLIIDNIIFEEANTVKTVKNKPQSKVKEKVIPINSRHKEVISLAQRGFNETEIARKLSMGKGEIRLILGVNK